MRRVLRAADAQPRERVSANKVRQTFHGRCSDPRQIEFRCIPIRYADNLRQTEELNDLGKVYPNLERTVRCRKCPECLRARSAHWRLRAEAELQRSVRTWFVTLTLNPDEQVKLLYRAHVDGVRWDTLSEGDRFARLANAGSPLLTKWLKRVRKESGANMRYLLVVEAHKSGLPHWHLLIHEASEVQPIRKRTLQRQWWHGFSTAVLVDGNPKTARYVCKYLSKSALARVRASAGYGKTTPLSLAFEAGIGCDRPAVEKTPHKRGYWEKEDL